MPELKRQIEVKRPIDEAFHYVADFANSADWDPGVLSAEQTAGDGPGVGAVYELVGSFGGKEMPMRYETVEYEPSTRVVLTGEGDRFRAVDTITMASTGDSSTLIDYVADIELKGIGKIATPFLGGTFDRLADDAVNGLHRALG
jgi:carbon monoxide dehydrogenase subunit G